MSPDNLDVLQPPTQKQGPDWVEYRRVIEHAIINSPRSLQTTIGPSQIGEPCTACLTLSLTGHQPAPEAAWLPAIGTAVHTWLEHLFSADNDRLDRVRYLVEFVVDVGTINGHSITGSADLFDLDTATVWDWKVVGDTSIRKAKAAESPAYVVQRHLYGRGFARRGLNVETVATAYLPRNKQSLAEAYISAEPYNEQVAIDALARAEQLAEFAHNFGVDAVLEACGGHTGESFSCRRHGHTLPATGAGPFRDLIGA